MKIRCSLAAKVGWKKADKNQTVAATVLAHLHTVRFFKNKSTDSFLLKLSKINFFRNRQYGALGPISLNTQLTDVEDLKFFCGGHCFDGMIHCCNDPLARSHYFVNPV